jgi:hypothetical protein
VAVDATGLAPGAISTFYVRRTQNRGGEPMLWRRWLISGSSWSTLIGRWCSGARGGLLCGSYNGSAMLCDHLWMAPMRLLRLGQGTLADAEFDRASTTTATCTNGSM